MSERFLSITILTEYYHPEEASTAQLMTELSTGLVRSAGFDISVVTGYPSYHDTDRSRSVSRTDDHEGVHIQRVRATRFDKDVLPLRVVNWLTFTALVLVRVLRNSAANANLVLSNPPILPLVAWLDKWLRGTPYVYVVYDVYPDMAIELGYISADGALARLWQRLMWPIYRDADRVVVLGDSMRTHLESKFEGADFDSNRIDVIPNWEDGESIQPKSKEENEFAREYGTIDRFTLVYSGNVGQFHELETAIDGIGLLEDQHRDDVQLLIIGEGARKAELQAHVRHEGIENVRFLPFQPLERLPETLTCGDAFLVGVKPEVEGLCVSSKLYSALAAGLPVLAVVGENDEVARIVDECQCGQYVQPGDAEMVADALVRWAEDPELTSRQGQNARECFDGDYRLQHAIEAYTNLLEGVAAPRSVQYE